MKKICVRVLFFIFSFINLSFADSGNYAGTIIRINCIPNLSTIELIQNDLLDIIEYYEWDENKLNQAKQNNYFLANNINYDDNFFETSCIIDKDTYTIKLNSGYAFSPIVSVNILKNNIPLFNKLFLMVNAEQGNIIRFFNFSYNTVTQEINSIVEYPYERETIYGLLLSDKQKWKTINLKEIEQNNELLNTPENWHEFDLSQKQIALFVDCNPLLEIAEVRTIPHNKQEFTTEEIAKLNQKGIYPLINNQLPQKISKQCHFDDNNYTINIDKNANFTLLQNDSEIIKDINFLPQNDAIVYLTYHKEDFYYNNFNIFSYKQNKLNVCNNNEKINEIKKCLNEDIKTKTFYF